MASSLSFFLEAIPRDVSVKEALSGIFGSVSLATWIFLLVCLIWYFAVIGRRLLMCDIVASTLVEL